MKHTQVIELKNSLKQLKGIKSVEVNYAIFENIERADSALKALSEQEKSIEDTIKEYNNERMELGKRLSTVDGEVKTKQEVTANGLITVFDIPEEKQVAFNAGVDELREKYAESIKEYEEKRAEFIKMVNEGDSPFVPYLIKKHHMPADIETEKMQVLFPLVRKPATDEQ